MNLNGYLHRRLNGNVDAANTVEVEVVGIEKADWHFVKEIFVIILR